MLLEEIWDERIQVLALERILNITSIICEEPRILDRFVLYKVGQKHLIFELRLSTFDYEYYIQHAVMNIILSINEQSSSKNIVADAVMRQFLTYLIKMN